MRSVARVKKLQIIIKERKLLKKVYFNGNFITLEEQSVEAVLIENSIIKKVGQKEEILKLVDEKTEVIDLNGKTMMPAFIDAHSHFSAVANEFLQVSLKNCKNFREIQEKLLKYKEENNVPEGKWINANGYDNNILIENKQITKKELDEVLPNNPIVIQHQSGHTGIMNSLGLKLVGITNETVSPDGGLIEKINGELTGYLEENAFIENVKKVPMPSIDDLKQAFKRAEMKYASYGIATVQEGFLPKELLNIYKAIVKENQCKLDVISYVDKNILQDIYNEFPKCIKKYYNHFKIGGIKIFLDGSPQARTAWMREPYIGDNNYYGYGTMKDEEVEEAINLAYKNKLQILAHCNGDRASQQYINAIKNITENNKEDISKIRPVLIHGQLLGINQLDEVKNLGIIPSYFIAHVYYWGDIHIKNFGKRAEVITPAGSSLRKNILFTFHQDSPVIEPNMFETIWCAVKRQTKTGVLLGNSEKINVIDAIKAVTTNSAYQYFEENEKGSIKEGKTADLIIVDKNPLNIDIDELREVKVLETIKGGETIFRY